MLKINNTSIEVTFSHTKPKLISYTKISCLPILENSSFYINEDHNKKFYGRKEPNGESMREVSPNDFVIKGFPIMALEVKTSNNLFCPIVVWGILKSCVKNQQNTYCNNFEMQFENGKISHSDVVNQNLELDLLLPKISKLLKLQKVYLMRINHNMYKITLLTWIQVGQFSWKGIY